jgi:hypothetical protein
MGVQYREEPCRSALNRVKGMAFSWSLNPYMGCVHRCTFCYVRAFERRADRPSDDRYGTSIRVKVNMPRCFGGAGPGREASRWRSAVTDPYQPAEGSPPPDSGASGARRVLESPADHAGPMIVRDATSAEAAKRAIKVRP